MKYLLLGGFGAIAGLLAGIVYAMYFMDPPPPVVINGHTYAPCALAIFPMMIEGGFFGLLTGTLSGLAVAKALPIPHDQHNPPSATAPDSE